MKIWITGSECIHTDGDRTVMRLAVLLEPLDTWLFHGYYGDLL